jgi:hypothetical protein
MIKYKVIINDDGDEIWHKEGKRHRDNDLPAVIYFNGSKFWYKKGQLHRENDLPAVIYADGTQKWYKDGEHHRENGPAVIWHDGEKEYWLNGRQVSEEEVMGKKYSIEDLKNMTVEELLKNLNN